MGKNLILAFYITEFRNSGIGVEGVGWLLGFFLRRNVVMSICWASPVIPTFQALHIYTFLSEGAISKPPATPNFPFTKMYLVAKGTIHTAICSAVTKQGRVDIWSFSAPETTPIICTFLNHSATTRLHWIRNQTLITSHCTIDTNTEWLSPEMDASNVTSRVPSNVTLNWLFEWLSPELMPQLSA